MYKMLIHSSYEGYIRGCNNLESEARGEMTKCIMFNRRQEQKVNKTLNTKFNGNEIMF